MVIGILPVSLSWLLLIYTIVASVNPATMPSRLLEAITLQIDQLCLKVAGAHRRRRTVVKTGVPEPKCYSEISTDNHCSMLNGGGCFTVDSHHTSCALRSQADEVCVTCGGNVTCVSCPGQPCSNAIVCYMQNSTGRLCRAVPHSSSASRFLRRVHRPLFCSWRKSP